MASARREALNAVKAGDVIYAVTKSGGQRVVLVYRADERRIYTRLITSQTRYKFGRSGQSHRTWSGVKCTIVSVAPLPAEDYATAIGLDRKMRTGKQHPDWVLSRAEIDLLLRVQEFFEAHPLPEE